MPNGNSREDVERALNQFQNLGPELRDRAFGAVHSYIQYIYASATGGAGPVAVPPPPAGSPSTTTGTFKCPSCGHNGTASYN
jgi:hypothetical protein